MKPSRRPMHGTRSFVLIASLSFVFYLIFIVRTAFHIGSTVCFTLVDDAMISMRYAQHFASGHGLVWNIGDPPIEGFTNLGWVGIMAFYHLFPIAPSWISIAVMLTSAILLVVNLHVVRRLSELFIPGKSWAATIPVVLTALFFPLVFWSLRGMELALMSLLINTALLVALRSADQLEWPATVQMTLLLSLALVVRIDAIVQVAVLTAFMLYASGLVRKRKHGYVALLAVVACLALLAVGRQAYFGDPLPNTYYLKVTGQPFLDRIRAGLLTFIQVTLDRVDILVLVVGIACLLKPRFSRRALLLGMLFIASCAYSVYVGGDYAESMVGGVNRFVAIGMVPLFVLFGKAVEMIFRTRIRGAFLFVLLFTTVGVLDSNGLQWAKWVKKNAPMLAYDENRVRLGLMVKDGTDPTARIAVHAAGQIPYYSERYAYDLLGKNDRVIAKGRSVLRGSPGHQKSNPYYSFVEKSPDVVVDPWADTDAYLSRLDGRYEQLQSGLWVMAGSELLNRKKLSQGTGE